VFSLWAPLAAASADSDQVDLLRPFAPLASSRTYGRVASVDFERASSGDAEFAGAACSAAEGFGLECGHGADDASPDDEPAPPSP